MTILRAWPLVLLLSACDKPPSTEAPTTATPDPAADGGTPDPGDVSAGAGDCKPSGCSGTVCSDQEVMTTCEYRPEYACYKTATCARQADGQCGWTASAELDACLANPPAE